MGLMGVLSNKFERENLKPGDHIYTWRLAYTYAHHGIYVGNENVIHFTCFTRGQSQDIGIGFVSSSPSYRPMGIPCSGCGDQSNLNGVIISCLDCFLSGGDLYLFEYGVSRAFFLFQVRGGTCTLASSDPPEEVIYRAKYLLQNGFGSYDIFKNNCEDFAIYCKTELLVLSSISGGRSGQAASFRAAAKAAASAVSIASTLRYLPAISFGLTAVGFGIDYCTSRLASDIGVRHDVQKVAVECLVAPSRSNESKASNESEASWSNELEASMNQGLLGPMNQRLLGQMS